MWGTIEVSIHAPTWGATKELPHFFIQELVSIHAPTWGATVFRVQCGCPYACFNPRSHMGSDISSDCSHVCTQVSIGASLNLSPTTDDCSHVCTQVSIHAPTWGATQHQGYQNGWEQFQSTLPHGERQHYDKYSLW